MAVELPPAAMLPLAVLRPTAELLLRLCAPMRVLLPLPAELPWRPSSRWRGSEAALFVLSELPKLPDERWSQLGCSRCQARGDAGISQVPGAGRRGQRPGPRAVAGLRRTLGLLPGTGGRDPANCLDEMALSAIPTSSAADGLAIPCRAPGHWQFGRPLIVFGFAWSALLWLDSAPLSRWRNR